ncbi:hypothetical protein [Bifidobacterium aemilianum]|nr:hypothetical protein [Bifidobacterium aemilianum]
MTDKRVTAATVLLSALMLVGLAGCGEPSLGEVAGRESAMRTFTVSPQGHERKIPAKGSSRLYLLAPRDQSKVLRARGCSLDGKTLKTSHASLNYPNSKGQTFFAFTQIDIDQQGDHKLKCDQPKADALMAVLESLS